MLQPYVNFLDFGKTGSGGVGTSHAAGWRSLTVTVIGMPACTVISACQISIQLVKIALHGRSSDSLYDSWQSGSWTSCHPQGRREPSRP